jgi:hypothetical protein
VGGYSCSTIVYVGIPGVIVVGDGIRVGSCFFVVIINLPFFRFHCQWGLICYVSV